MSDSRHVIVAGGGIGGLTAAIALHRVGMKITIIERANEFREIGAGLWLWQNALVALDSVGVGEAVRGAGIRNAHGGIRTQDGTVLVARVPSDPRYESVAILRADLQNTLLQAVDADDIHYGTQCVGFTQTEQRVVAQLSNGRELQADVLIGADGIHSVIRGQLFGAEPPRYAGFTAWRAVTTFPHDQIPAGVAWGQGARFGFMPVSRGRVNWFAGVPIAANTPAAAAGRKSEVLARFRNWFDPVPAVIEATAEDEIIRNDIYTSPLLQTWSRGRVTLLGDAAHAMTPSIGQGACQAIEDAVVLAQCLHNAADMATALQEYERRRIARTRAITRYARLMDSLALWTNPLLCKLRNVVISHSPDRWRDRQMNWIIGHELGN